MPIDIGSIPVKNPYVIFFPLTKKCGYSLKRPIQ